jgi:hypothetical protein
VNAVMNHKMLGNYRVASQLVASRVVLSSIQLDSKLTPVIIVRLYDSRRVN